MPSTSRTLLPKKSKPSRIKTTDGAVSRARAASIIGDCVFITRRQLEFMNKKETAKIELKRILRKLIDKKIPFVLTGAHANAVWMGFARATMDVDILVKGGRNHSRAVKAIRELYPHLECRDFQGLTAFFVPGETHSVIEVTLPRRADNEETLASRFWVEEGDLRYRIPFLEAALANKYGAMLSLTRDVGKRLQDAADFTFMVNHSTQAGSQPIDAEKLRALGEKVWPGGGGEEILQLIEEIKRGQILDLKTLVEDRPRET